MKYYVGIKILQLYGSKNDFISFPDIIYDTNDPNLDETYNYQITALQIAVIINNGNRFPFTDIDQDL